MKTILSIVCSLFLLPFINLKDKPFPEINYSTNQGSTFTNDDFKGKNTVGLLFHLGCPPAMGLLRDIETMNVQSDDQVQIIGIVENTPEQIKQFNADDKNEWSDLRKSFQLAPIKFPMIGECGSNNSIGEEAMPGEAACRILAKEIRTEASPTLVYVNSDGNITKVKKGYLSSEFPQIKRIEYLLKEKA